MTSIHSVTGLAVTASGATSATIDYSNARGGIFLVTALATGVSCTYQVAMTKGGTLGDLKDENDVVITQNLTSGDAYAFPPEAFGADQMVLVLNAGTATIDVARKS